MAFDPAQPAANTALASQVRIHVTLVNASAGTVQLQGSNSSGGGTVTLKANSDLVARRTG